MVSSEPPYKTSESIPFDNSRSFSFGTKIPSGQSCDFTFTLKAEAEGVYRGDIDICEGVRVMTTMT